MSGFKCTLYVRYSHLIEGDETLKLIENSPTHYESPTDQIIFSHCDLYGYELRPATPIEEEYFKTDLCQCVDNLDWTSADGSSSGSEMIYGPLPDIGDSRDLPSVLSERLYNLGRYFCETDLRSYKEAHYMDIPFKAPPPSIKSSKTSVTKSSLKSVNPVSESSSTSSTSTPCSCCSCSEYTKLSTIYSMDTTSDDGMTTTRSQIAETPKTGEMREEIKQTALEIIESIILDATRSYEIIVPNEDQKNALV